VRACAALIAAALACSAPERDARDPGAPAGRIVRGAELSQAQRAAWAAWQAGGAAWEIELERVRRDPDLARFVVDNLVRVCVQAYGRSDLAPAGAEPGPFERARADLVVLAEHSTPVLVELLRVPDGIVAFLAADCLGAIGAHALPGVVALLTDARPETRRRAAELLGRLPHAGAREDEILAALAARVRGDEAWPVRAEAARALGARGARHATKRPALDALLAALADPDPMVARSAAVGLGTLGELAAIPPLATALERAARAGEPGLVREIGRALERIAGDGRSRSLEEWRRFRPPEPGARAAPDGR